MMTKISFFVKKEKKITCTDDKNMFKINFKGLSFFILIANN